MSDWEVSRASGHCLDCGREFAEKDDFFASLVEKGELFERIDRCIECWPKVKDQGLIFWKTRVPPRQESRKKVFVDDIVLVDFFRRLAEAREPQRQRFRFVLTLVMMRKRLLKYVRSVRHGDQEYWQVMLMDDRKEYPVLDPGLSEEQIADLSTQLGQILSDYATAEETPAESQEPADEPPTPQEAPA